MSSSDEIFGLINQNLQDIETSLREAAQSTLQVKSNTEAMNTLIAHLIDRFNFLLNFYINSLKEKKRLTQQLAARDGEEGADVPDMGDAEFGDDDEAQEEISRLQNEIATLTSSIGEAEAELSSQSAKSESEKLALVQRVSEQATQITELLARIDELERRVIPPASDEIVIKLRQVNERLNRIKAATAKLISALKPLEYSVPENISDKVRAINTLTQDGSTAEGADLDQLIQQAEQLQGQLRGGKYRKGKKSRKSKKSKKSRKSRKSKKSRKSRKSKKTKKIRKSRKSRRMRKSKKM